jgi:hypothetical protein
MGVDDYRIPGKRNELGPFRHFKVLEPNWKLQCYDYRRLYHHLAAGECDVAEPTAATSSASTTSTSSSTASAASAATHAYSGYSHPNSRNTDPYSRSHPHANSAHPDTGYAHSIPTDTDTDSHAW